METLITGLGLSTAAGLNAYLPLIIMNLAARTGLIDTQGNPAEIMTSAPALGVLVVLLIIEMTADKIPVVDSVNDMVNTAVRPAAGVILMMVSTSELQGSIDPETLTLISLIGGGGSAGGVHALKAGSRPVVTATTGGIGNPIVSVLEDISSLMMALLAVLLPFIMIFFFMSFFVLFFWWLWERGRLKRLEYRGYRVRSR